MSDFEDSLSTGIFGKGNDLHYQGAHDWIFGGTATKGINTKLGGYDQAQAQLGQLGGTRAPMAQAAQLGQAYQLNQGQMDQSRGGMMLTANRLGAIAGGQQAGAGEMAVNRQVGQAQSAQASAARQARGANAALAYHNGMRNSADIGLAGAGQAAAAQMQDQQAANAQLGQLYGSMYGQDANVATQNAQLGQQQMLQQGAMNQQTALANQNAELQGRALQIQALGQQLGWSKEQIDLELQRAGIDAADKGMFAGLLGGVGGMMAKTSDRRLKTNIRSGDDDADEFMRSMSPNVFGYKDPDRWGKGHELGVMVQDMAKSKMGRQAIVKVDDHGHLGFDIGRATGAALASVARLSKRLGELEAKAR